MRIAHLTTVDISLRYLILPQMEKVVDLGGDSIGISADGPFVSEVEARGIRHIALPDSTRSIDIRKDLKTALALWRILKKEKPDVLHTHTPKPGIYGRIVGRLAGVPVVVNTIHGLYATPDDRFIKRLLVYTLEAVASRFSDRELVQSREDYEFVKRRRITRPNRTVLLGNGVDLDRFSPDRIPQHRRNELRRSIGAGPDDVVFGSVGRLVREKGFPELFEAARKMGPGTLLVVVGPQEPDKQDGLTDAEIRAAQAAGVRLPGMQTNVDEWYAAMDVFVLASHREGFPRAAMEAAAMGLPIIATDIRGCREVVDDGVNGLMVEVRNPVALAEAINKLARSAETRQRMGRASTDKARTSFDEQTIVDTVLRTQITAMREKGLFHPLGGTSDFAFRPAQSGDAAVIARLHAVSITTGFLSTLGPVFLEQLYRAMIDYHDSEVIVAEDRYGPVGFVAGMPDVAAFYKSFVARNGARAGIAASGALLKPSSWRKAWETARYDGGHQGTSAELLSMAIAPTYRGRGLGTDLSDRLLASLRAKGIQRVKVVVGFENKVAQRVYGTAGFVKADTIEVHRGEKSVVMVSDRP